jgi:hypothetical protein
MGIGEVYAKKLSVEPVFAMGILKRVNKNHGKGIGGRISRENGVQKNQNIGY